jgi:hypothetical protein
LEFNVKYPDGYPDELPELSATPVEGDIDDDEITELLNGLRTLVGQTAHNSSSDPHATARAKKTLEWQ